MPVHACIAVAWHECGGAPRRGTKREAHINAMHSCAGAGAGGCRRMYDMGLRLPRVVVLIVCMLTPCPLLANSPRLPQRGAPAALLGQRRWLQV